MCAPDERSLPKLAGLDCLRGLGALFVVAHHLLLSFHPWVVLGEPYASSARWEAGFHRFPLSLLICGRFAVQMFFVLSGVVLSLGFFGARARSDSELAAAAFKRTFRLAPMLIFGVALVLAANSFDLLSAGAAAKLSGSEWLATKPSATVRIGTVLHDVLLNLFVKAREYNSPLWTIGTELYGSFLVFFVLFLLRRLSWRWLLYPVLFVWFRSDARLPFLLGIVLADLHRSTRWFGSWCAHLAVLVPSIITASVLASFPAGLDPAHKVGWIPGGRFLINGGPWLHLLGALLVVAIPMGNDNVNRLLGHPFGRYLARISYALYATHEVVLLSLCSGLYLRWQPAFGSGRAGILVAMVGVPVMIALAELGTRMVDKPSLRLAEWVAGRFLGSSRTTAQSGRASI